MYKNVLVFGANGQLGKSLQKVISREGTPHYNLIFISKNEADITKTSTLVPLFKQYTPSYVINCAAYTQVDLAEEEKEKAYQINVVGVQNISQLCEDYQACLVHVSTDFVFEGNTPILLKETDVCMPINHYGTTKWQGEQVIQQHLKAFFIIRTSWLYSEFGTNFMKTMLRLSKEKNSLSIVNDQIGTPTYAVDLATFIIHIIHQHKTEYGIYHFSNEGIASWYDFAKAIFEYSNRNIKVSPIASEEYPTKAKRPLFSAMNTMKVKKTFGRAIPHWRTSLASAIEASKSIAHLEKTTK